MDLISVGDISELHCQIFYEGFNRKNMLEGFALQKPLRPKFFNSNDDQKPFSKFQNLKDVIFVVNFCIFPKNTLSNIKLKLQSKGLVAESVLHQSRRPNFCEKI